VTLAEWLAGKLPAQDEFAAGYEQARDDARAIDRKDTRWNKRLWGVLFTGSMKYEEPMLLGATWHKGARPSFYAGEPTRALLFCTRHAARTWCAEKMKEWQYGRQSGDLVLLWRVRPVRVVERVCVINREDRHEQG
jgi:hypothetical protein